jgi:hypothetical protein
MRQPILNAAKDGTILDCMNGEIAALLDLTRGQMEELCIESVGPGTGVKPAGSPLHGCVGYIRYSLELPPAEPHFHSYSTMGGSGGYLITQSDPRSALQAWQQGVKNAFIQWIRSFSNASPELARDS